jgi:hypothetical protein
VEPEKETKYKFELTQMVLHVAEDPYRICWGAGIIMSRGMAYTLKHPPQPIYYVCWANRSRGWEDEELLQTYSTRPWGIAEMKVPPETEKQPEQPKA